MGNVTDDVTDQGFEAVAARLRGEGGGPCPDGDAGEDADGNCWAPWTDTGGEG